jgi:hypothetical protein
MSNEKGRPAVSEMRYRKPSIKTVLGITKWKKRIKKALGINKLLWPFRAVGNYQRRMLRRAGYYRPEMKMMRAMKRGQVAGPIGPLQVGEHGESGSNDNSLLMAAMLTNGTQGKEGKGRKDGPDLAQAMLLAAALKDEQAEEKPKAKHAAEEHAPKRHAKAQPESKHHHQ